MGYGTTDSESDGEGDEQGKEEKEEEERCYKWGSSIFGS